MRISDWSSDLCSSDLTGHKAGLGSQHLALAAVVTKLAHCLDHMVESPDMRLTEQAAMGVDRIAATQLNLAIGYEFRLCTRFAIAHRFQLQQNDIGKAVVNLQEIHVLALDARHVESARGSIAEIGRASCRERVCQYV